MLFFVCVIWGAEALREREGKKNTKEAFRGFLCRPERWHCGIWRCRATWMGPGCRASPEAGSELSGLAARLAVAARETFVFVESKLLCAQDFSQGLLQVVLCPLVSSEVPALSLMLPLLLLGPAAGLTVPLVLSLSFQAGENAAVDDRLALAPRTWPLRARNALTWTPNRRASAQHSARSPARPGAALRSRRNPSGLWRGST